MAHELTIRAGGRAEMAYAGATPWHGLGQRLPEGASIPVWLEAAGMDWEIQGSPVLYNTGGKVLQMADRQVLYRSDDWAPLGVVSDGYRVVQPREVLEFFRDLTEESGFKIETAGTLFGGRRFWALARVTGDVPILDRRDRVGGYLLLSTSADGSLSTEARWTTVRVVCNNTLSLSLRAGKPNVRVTHRTDFNPDEAKRALGLNVTAAGAAFEDAMSLFRRLASTPLTKNDMVALTLRAFGHDPEKMSRQQLEEAAGKKAVVQVGGMAITGAGLLGAELEGGQGTAWGWLNSVTQFVDHQARARSQSHRLNSAWFDKGDSTKARALELAAGVAGDRGGFIAQVLAPVA